MYKSNRKQLNSKIQSAFHRTCDRFGDALDDAMDEKIYDWPNRTYRKSGEIVDSPRNIVDTGYLRNSRYDISGVDQCKYTYPADYAQDVLNGYVDEYGNDKPGRNWAKVAVESENWNGVYEQEWNKSN